ncbi:MAG: aminoglycoside phosphotransferase family protein, partial [Actinomycetota bacterium]|nr:aminoglycoside phosphotransferase family protein [Actinomycetota bacterium]
MAPVIVNDPALPGMAALLGDEARSLLEVAVRALGAELVSYRPYQTSYRPGRRMLVHYECTVVLPSDVLATWTLVAMTATDGLPEGVLLLDGGSARVAVWRFPYDPFLPGLPSAVDHARVREVLDTFGAAPGSPLLAVRSYRATRRAVVEVRVGRQRLFLKVVRPNRAAQLHRVHLALAEALPVPPSLGWSPEQGIVVLPALPGRTLTEQLGIPDAPLPHPDVILALCDRLATVPLATSRAVSPVFSAQQHARTLTALLPALGERLEQIVEALSTAESATATVHGDLHPAQLLTTEVVTGLLDVDRAGRGATADDHAMLLGHLRVLAETQKPPLRARTEAFAAQLRIRCLEHSDASDLSLREAAVMLGLATAPFRLLEDAWRSTTEHR